MQKTILVTGANGQLGMELRNISKSSSSQFIFTDINEVDGYSTEYLDITDIESVTRTISNYHVNVIVNCAAYTNVDEAETNSEKANLLNNVAPTNLATAAKRTNSSLIHISTDYVFDGQSYIPYTEKCSPKPTCIYGITKLAGEMAIRDSGCKYLIIRTAWLYSPYGKNFIKTILKLILNKDNINVVFDQIGSPTYAADLAAVIYEIINKDMLDRQGIYHYTNEGICSWYDFAIAAQELYKSSQKVKPRHSCTITPCHSDEFHCIARRPHYSVLDKSKIKQDFGLIIPHWYNSLKKCLTDNKMI